MGWIGGGLSVDLEIREAYTSDPNPSLARWITYGQILTCLTLSELEVIPALQDCWDV